MDLECEGKKVHQYTGRINNANQSVFEYVPVEFHSSDSCIIEMAIYSIPIDFKYKDKHHKKKDFEEFFNMVTKKGMTYTNNSNNRRESHQCVLLSYNDPP